MASVCDRRNENVWRVDQSGFVLSKKWLAKWPEKYFSVCSRRFF